MKKVTIGMIGTGFAAALHAESYARVYGIDLQIKTVCSLDPELDGFARRHGIANTCADYHALLRDPEIDAVDIITPPSLHLPMIRDALRAGKHVICEKPISGCFELDPATGRPIGRGRMLERVRRDLAELSEVLERSGCIFLYAENFIYAPAVRKAASFLEAKKSKILFMKGEESHCGSHAPHAAHWRANGGGAFIRQGCHPLSAVLHLKQVEAAAHSERITVKSVLADVGMAGAALSEKEHRHIHSHPADVEDIANVILTFSDGTKANLIAGDMVVGGVRNKVELYTGDGVCLCNIAPNDALQVYNADETGLENLYITEKLGTKSGWQQVFLEEALMRGYTGELQDFAECLAFGRAPISGFALARETAEIVYAAYLSAEEGRRVDL